MIMVAKCILGILSLPHCHLSLYHDGIVLMIYFGVCIMYVVSWKWMYDHDSLVSSALAGWTRVFVIIHCNVILYGFYTLYKCTDSRTLHRKIKTPGWLHVKNKNTYNYATWVNCLSLFVSLWCIRVNKVPLNYTNWQNDYALIYNI